VCIDLFLSAICAGKSTHRCAGKSTHRCAGKSTHRCAALVQLLCKVKVHTDVQSTHRCAAVVCKVRVNTYVQLLFVR